MEIKILKPEDQFWQTAAKLMAQVSWPAGKYLSKQMQTKKFQPFECVIVLMDGDKLAGFAALLAEDIVDNTGLTPFISTVFVDEQYRGQGLSKILVKTAEEQAQKAGFKTVYIVTQHVGLYEKSGYEQFSKGVDKFDRPMRMLKKKI